MATLAGRPFERNTINPPGWGGTTPTGPMSQEEIGRPLAPVAERLVTAGPFHVIGTSMGGGNALWLAYFATQRIAGIILEGFTAPGRPEDMVMPPTKEPLAARRDVTAKTGQLPYPLPPSHPRKTWATPDYVNQQMVNRFAMTCDVETDFSSAPELVKGAEHDIQNTAPEAFVRFCEEFIG
jgi:pimeloyl-ACP methyl ester carboxylesterase